MRRIGPFIAWSFSAALSAQPIPNALLWTVVGADPTDTCYVYGTMHSKDERAFVLAPAVERVIPRCATVAGELDLEGTGNVALTMMGRLLLPTGTELSDLYRKAKWKRLEPKLKEKLGPLAVMMGRMKPFFVLASLMEGEMVDDRERMLDDALMQHGRDLGKRVIGLETMDEQMNALDAIPLQEQAEMLYQHVLGGGSGDDLDAMLEAYAQQDLERLWTITNSASTSSLAFEKALLTDRNATMVQRMDSVIRADKTALFLIGAAHLPGPSGLIAELRDRGYRVEPAIRTQAPSPAVQPKRAPHLE